MALAFLGCGSATQVVTRTVTPPAPPRSLAASAPATVSTTPLQTVHGGAPDVRLQLLSVARSGPSVVTAHMRILASEQVVWTDAFRDDGEDEHDFSGVRMVDEVHAKQYLPLRDETGECLCTRSIGNPMYVDHAMDISVKFPAPPADVDSVSVQVPTFASFDAVPLS
jgi:hypothetical protein